MIVSQEHLRRLVIHCAKPFFHLTHKSSMDLLRIGVAEMLVWMSWSAGALGGAGDSDRGHRG